MTKEYEMFLAYRKAENPSVKEKNPVWEDFCKFRLITNRGLLLIVDYQYFLSAASGNSKNIAKLYYVIVVLLDPAQ